MATTRTRPRFIADLRLIELVGSGGEGEVWQARDAVGRRRALKLVRPDALAADAPSRVRALVRIDDPALVRVHRGGLLEAGPLAGWGWLEMDFEDGEPLQAAPGDLAMLDRLSPLAAALDRLHAGTWSDGVAMIHRDVKPANLISRPDGSLVLVDPSTLRGVDHGEVTRIGTPLFCAPEILTGRIGPAADVYSFAATAVALATGARGDALRALLDDVAELDLPSGVRRALSRRPSSRPRSCAAVLDQTLRFAEAGGWEPYQAGAVEIPDAAFVQTQVLGGSDGDIDGDIDGDVDGDMDGDVDGDVDGDLDDLDGPDGDEDGDDLDEADRTDAGPFGRLWPWLAILIGLAAAPLGVVAYVTPITGVTVAGAVAVGIAVHLLGIAVARGSMALAVFAPPVAWGFVLADRAGGDRLRQGWARAVCTGAALGLTAGAVASVSGVINDPLPLAAGVLGVALSVAALRVPGVIGALLRLLVLPLWALGAGVLAAAAIVLLPFGLFSGRGRALGRLLASSVTGIVEVFRAPPR